MFMARDAMGLVGIDMEDEGESLPEPSNFESVTCEDGDTVTLVDVDFDEYRRRNDNRSVKKTLSIPSWLNETALANNVNFSAVLQEALKAQLHL